MTMFFLADNGLVPVGQCQKAHIHDHVITKRLLHHLLGDLYIRTLALYNHHRTRPAVEDHNVGTELLFYRTFAVFHAHFAHHHVHGNLHYVPQHSDEPLTHPFFRCQCHILFSERIPDLNIPIHNKSSKSYKYTEHSNNNPV